MKFLPKPSVPRLRIGLHRTRSPHFCGECGALLPHQKSVGDRCVACGVQLTKLLDQPLTSTDITHQTALKQAIDNQVKRGYYIVRQRGDFVEMRKPRKLSKAWVGAWLVAGVPLPGVALIFPGAYAVWHALREEDGVYLFVGAGGKVRTEKAK